VARDLRDRSRVLGAVPARDPRPGIRLRPGSFAGQARPTHSTSARAAPSHRVTERAAPLQATARADY